MNNRITTEDRFPIIISRDRLVFYDGKENKTSEGFRTIYDLFYGGEYSEQLFDSGFDTDYPQARLKYEELQVMVIEAQEKEGITFNKETQKGQRELDAVESIIRAHVKPIPYREGSLGFMYPCGGHVVKMAYWWEWGKIGIKCLDSLGVIDGCVQRGHTDDVQITFNAYSKRYRTSNGLIYISSDGGPGTISTPVSELERSNETIEQRFWVRERTDLGQFQDAPYTICVPVWYWHPKQGA